MTQILLAVAFLGFASCGPLDSQYVAARQGLVAGQYSGPINQAANDVPILRLDNENDGETYSYALETGNGISAQEQGDARGDGTNAQGGFSYTAPDGQQIQVKYTAGPNGFEAQGAHLPVAPPIPEEILRAVEANLADEARGVVDDGQYRAEASPVQKYGVVAPVAQGNYRF